ncbi:hypothetical protein BD779DRAFT_1799641 [Infundibulicybe gibba]|nr:hypothetical protein BD779DRAFT_1799641 [Infundibulicybe gibba]
METSRELSHIGPTRVYKSRCSSISWFAQADTMLALHALAITLIASTGSAHAAATIPHIERRFPPRTPKVCSCPTALKACTDAGKGCCPDKSQCVSLLLNQPQCLGLPGLPL